MSWMISNSLMKAYENSHCLRAQEGGYWLRSYMVGGR